MSVKMVESHKVAAHKGSRMMRVEKLGRQEMREMPPQGARNCAKSTSGGRGRR